MTTTERDVLVEGTLVRLRRKRLVDAAIDYSWRQDAMLARYDAARPITLTYEEFVAQYMEELSYPQPFRRTSAIEDQQGVHIGNVMYYNIDLHRREAELGITIGNRAYWGHGYGTESVTLLLNYIFTETTITRVYLHTLDWNVRAQRAFCARRLPRLRKVPARRIPVPRHGGAAGVVLGSGLCSPCGAGRGAITAVI